MFIESSFHNGLFYTSVILDPFFSSFFVFLIVLRITVLQAVLEVIYFNSIVLGLVVKFVILSYLGKPKANFKFGNNKMKHETQCKYII